MGRLLLTSILVFSVSYASGMICMEDECHFELTISQRRSMSYKGSDSKVYNVEWNETRKEFIVIGSSFTIDWEMIGTVAPASEVYQTDGFSKNIYVINDQFPGPTLEVMEGAQVHLRVVNKLDTEALTIHVHGMHFQDNVWMDGSGNVNQCPIAAGHTFEYKFKADPAGTFWYHSHFRNTRIDGIYGAFLVHPRVPQIPYHVVMVQDWFHTDAFTNRVTHPFDHEHPGTGDHTLAQSSTLFSQDGVELSAMRYDSTLINGLGRNGHSVSVTSMPLTTFNVTTGVRYRFHLINTAAEFLYDVKIDGHKLDIVSLDGQPIVPIVVDSVILTPGERVDFEIVPSSSQEKYWLRADTLRYGIGKPLVGDGLEQGGKAIVQLDTSDSTADPTSQPTACTAENPCVVFNCPFKVYRTDQFKTCISLDEAESSYTQEYLNEYYGLDDDDIVEYFLNWGYNYGSSVNGKKFAHPIAPFMDHDPANIIQCDDLDCGEGCYCAHILDIPAGKTVQIVLSNYYIFGGHHNVHLHGYNFAVLKIGFPDYNETTGLVRTENDDVICNTDTCTQPSWNGGRSQLNMNKPPIKDTVILPYQGYTVIRFKSTNPGYWPLHCHMETHFEEGMGMVINVGAGHHPPIPSTNQRCPVNPNYASIPEMETSTRMNENEGQDQNSIEDHDDDDDEDEVTMSVNSLIGAAAGFVILGAVLATIPVLMFACCSMRYTQKK